MFRLGLVINPLAGIGGSVALKGSDGTETVKAAYQLGARPRAQDRTASALEQIQPYRDQIKIYTAANAMGEDLCRQMGFDVELVSHHIPDETSADDTEACVGQLLAQGIDLLLFAGGDGTARNVFHVMQENNQDQMLPVIGVPAGCKIHSAVYAVTPKHAGELLALIIKGRPLAVQEAAVMDIDEAAFRDDRVRAKLYGQLHVPAESQYMQNMKDGGVEHEALVLQDIAAYINETMDDDVLYFMGSGSTPKAIMDELGLESTLLGVDLVENQQLVASDVNEKQILSFLKNGKPAKIILTIIGGQGHLFGRGNQQFSSEVIRKIGKENIIIIATPEKLHALNGQPVRVDTGDEKLNDELCGMIQIITGYDQHTLYKIG
ncbi:MAG: ATP-NAD kinase family protein [Gammaproteobacteria bacterium]|nr:ATP-NAD kinase family protein [Gammaproteobacteria bacterium]MCW8910443.1 ATP-NAD kinase family protein [Gammaproteobacteria bacterium]MCW9056875.1 ATP-NAD kinase family protein [Gammaproteobacteria bacterium]